MIRTFSTFFSLIFLTLQSAALSSFTLPDDFVVIFDVNGTLVAQDTTIGKTDEIAKYQVVASQLQLKNGLNGEQYLKELYPVKKEQVASYTKIESLANSWVEEGLLDINQTKIIPTTLKLVEESMKECCTYGGLFPSAVRCLEFLQKTNPNARIVLNSFGSDLDEIVALLSEYCPGLKVHKNKGRFDEEGVFHFDSQPIKLPFKVLDTVQPGINLWKACFPAWSKNGKKCGFGGKPVFVGRSIFFDDNADICTWPVVDGQYMNETLPLGIFGRESHKVDRLKVLRDPDYYIDLLTSSVPKILEG